MGLDMYLEKAKRIGDVTPRQLRNIDGYFSWKDESKSGSHYSMKEWCGIDEKDVDMSLVKDYRNEYVHRYASWDREKKFGWKTIIETIADWRKANHIHKWFVDNVQDGVDDCGIYEVTKEQLEELLDVCKEVINNSNLVNGEYIEDSSVAEELLPTTEGFFFGSTQYDKWYIEDIKYTIKVIEDMLNTTDFEHEIIMYNSSW